MLQLIEGGLRQQQSLPADLQPAIGKVIKIDQLERELPFSELWSLEISRRVTATTNAAGVIMREAPLDEGLRLSSRCLRTDGTAEPPLTWKGAIQDQLHAVTPLSRALCQAAPNARD
jgi:hypothetical protein